MTQRKTAFSFAPLILSALFFASCNSAGGPASGLSTKNEVVIYAPQDADFINPMLSSSELSNYVQGEMFDALTGQNPRTQGYIPDLAFVPTESPDHLTLTFTMDSTAHWSDGKPVTAEDIVFSYKIVNNPLIVNVAPLRSYFGNLDSCWIPAGHPDQVVFHYNKYEFDLLKITNYARIIPKHVWDPTDLTDKFSWADLKKFPPTNPAIKELADHFQDPKIQRDPGHIIGSGPYKFDSWITNDHITLVRDTNYWARNHPWAEAYPDKITFKTILDQNAALIALKHGDIDLDDNLTPAQYLTDVDTTTSKDLVKDTVYENIISLLGYNNARPLFSDKMVRKALTMLIDRDEILHSILHDMGKKIEGIVAPTQPNFDPTVKEPAYNVDSAKLLLAQAGWKPGSDGILQKTINGKLTPFQFTMVTQSGNDLARQELLIISNDFKKAGIDARVSQLELSVFGENLRNHNFDAYLGGWAGNTAGQQGVEDEPGQVWESSQSKNGGSNYYSYSDPVADSLMKAINVEPDRAKRFAMSHQVQHIITDDQPVTFLFSSPFRLAWRNRFDNFELFPARPPYAEQYWIVKGSGVKRIPGDAVMSMNPAEREEPTRSYP
ncbi:MAG TPA: ABC transporter substrate-binding protein [Candidatus Kapabacteria bacterium]|nr:ABC transporter substrate-binding protein [Candidatus Kapabacteria bacterium]